MRGTRWHQLQKDSLKTLDEVRFPDRKNEDWKYTAVQQLMAPKYQLPSTTASIVDLPAIPALENYVISIHNGDLTSYELHPDLKQLGVSLVPLHDAYDSGSLPSVFQNRISPEEKQTAQAFEFMNLAFHGRGFFMDIPQNVIIDRPIELRITHQDQSVSFSHPLYFVRAGRGSQMSWIERIEYPVNATTPAAEALINTMGFFALEQNAQVNHYKWQHLAATQSLVHRLVIDQQRDSRFLTTTFDFGGKMIRNNVEASLQDQNTFTSLEAAYLVTGKNSVDHQTRIDHNVPHGESHELYKGILDDKANGAFNGKVFVAKDAQKTNAFQQNDTLVLSPFAVMNSKPQLEIFADDVRCSHGATIGQFDEKALFYLRSRGIDIPTATRMLKSAFLSEILDHVSIEPLKAYIANQMGINV